MRNAQLVPFTSNQNHEEVKDILDTFNPQSGQKLPHKVFMEIIAKNDRHAQRRDLDYQDPNSEIIIQDCEVRFLDEYCQRREDAIVFEDNTHKYLSRKYTLNDLKKTIKFFVKGITGGDTDARYFEEMVETNLSRTKYYKNKGISNDEAFCCALVLSFYTGKNGTQTSEAINRQTSQIVRFGNEPLQDASSKEFLPLMYFMIKALSYIPYYWGPCIRAVVLTREEQSRYVTGSIVSWTQFSSSTSDSKVPSYFTERNTIFHLYSVTGRDITPFSNFPLEKEVLFAPYSTFLVTKKEIVEGKTHIYMRQIELGLTEHSLLWIDDRILCKEWENKLIMEKLTGEGLGKNLHIIPKPSTRLALSYLDSKFGQFLKKNPSFQIISDMKRPHEENGDEAGARCLKQIRARGFNHKFGVYTMDAQAATKAITRNVEGSVGEVFVTTVQSEVIKYLQAGMLAEQADPKSILRRLLGF